MYLRIFLLNFVSFVASTPSWRMTLITRNTVFLHIGRCAGHSIGNSLWRAGIVERQLRPLHLRPIELKKNIQAIAKPFWFCFVRHPLAWLASVWGHTVSYGDTDPTLPATNDFSNFLEELLARHPDGPVTERLFEYVDSAHFVGKVEALREDLVRALTLAAEPFDESTFVVPEINGGDAKSVTHAAKAPRVLLNEVLERDHEFARRFSYDTVPDRLVDDERKRPCFFPSLRLKGDLEAGPLYEGLQQVSFDYSVWLSNGLKLNAASPLTRVRLQQQIGLESISDRSRKAIATFIESDGICSHIASGLGFHSATGVINTNRMSRELLDAALVSSVEYIDIENLRSLREKFDVVAAPHFFQAGSPSSLLSALTATLRPSGGELLLQTVLLRDLDFPVAVPLTPLTSPMRPLTRFLFSWSGFVNLLEGAGVFDTRIVDEFLYKDPDDQAVSGSRAEDLGKLFGLDPETMFTMVMVKAVYKPEQQVLPGVTTLALEDAWYHLRPLWHADAANSKENAPQFRLIQNLQHAIQTIELEKAIARGALADREADLAAARLELEFERRKVAELALEAKIWRSATADREQDLMREREELKAWRKDPRNPYPESTSMQLKHAPEAITRSISSITILGFVSAVCRSFGTRARAMRAGSSGQVFSRNSRRATITGTSRDAGITETRD
jgi:hypothetical protein